MIIGLHHAQITIPPNQEEQAKQFYCGVLGLEEIAKPAALAGRGGFWVTAGDRQIHIGTENGVDRMRTKAHLAYQVEDIAEAECKLAEAGIEVLDAVPIPGYERFEFRDPFGNRVELIQKAD
ncbi:VOC family protein [Paenibacillus sp. FJAT-26967]|uniref:VOC family protein n=1 Tax=Paenibacillus sp. FJAT-26967 TaxID=1729690 RepID=UPI0008385AA0|nr:VOC family protein [Paenibacillus sp. FJAT-26967]